MTKKEMFWMAIIAALVIIGLGVFMEVTGDHKEAVSILENGFGTLVVVVVAGLAFGWWDS